MPTDDLTIAVVVDNEVTRRGVAAVVQQVPKVRLRAGPDGADVVIASPRALSRADTLRGHDDGRQHKLLVLLDEPDQVDIVRWLTPDGYLLATDLTPESLHRTLAQLADGQVVVPAELSRHLLKLATGRTRRDRGRAPVLTSRERETLALLAEGLSNRQIGRRLGVSEHGAKRLVGSIMTKLDSPNRTLAVAIALRERLIQAEPA
ncbi:response regulator transcription factor [Micromonospora sp. NPDC049903]|uniref:response regulator transcription factor n=1 Tax=Micromonospora sp. NPDC049903 TaxID=3364276 RepID=UPI003787DE9A